jgi:hypothetical protein
MTDPQNRNLTVLPPGSCGLTSYASLPPQLEPARLRVSNPGGGHRATGSGLSHIPGPARLLEYAAYEGNRAHCDAGLRVSAVAGS